MEQRELLVIISTLFTFVVSLVIYLWKQKDKQYDKFGTKLDEILKVSIHTSKEVDGLKKDIDHISQEYVDLKKQHYHTSVKVQEMSTNVAVLMEFKQHMQDKNYKK